MTGPYQIKGSRAVKGVLAMLLLALAFWISGVEAVVARVVQFPLRDLISIVLFLTANLWLVAFRLWRVLAHFSIRVPWAIASRASVMGHAAGLVMISLVGQVVGRQAVLREFGISPVVNATLAGYERVLLTIVSSTLAFLGGVYLLGQSVVVDFFQRIPLFEITLLVMLSAALSFWMGGTAFEARLSKRVLVKRNVSRVAWIVALTAVGQVLILASFGLGVLALRPETPMLSAFAAGALISFAATLPITINGWGVRELAAVLVLGSLGIPATDAVAVSVVIGVCATLVILAATPFAYSKSAVRVTSHPAPATCGPAILEIEKAAAWLLGMAAAATIFFQFHVELPAGVLNINLADAFAILALAAVSLHAVVLRQPPQWRVPAFNRMLLLSSALLLFGFINGWLKIGATQWALGGRLLGWLILLGYLSSGYLLVSHAGARGARRLAETLAATAVVIVLWQAASRVLVHYGWEAGHMPIANFEGYSSNRNAFAFQLLAVMALLLAYSRVHALCIGGGRRRRGSSPGSLLLSVVTVGVVWTGSRAGMLAGAILLLVGGLSGMIERRAIIRVGLLAGLLWGAIWLVQCAAGASVQVQGALSGDNSDNERWITWVHAFELWRQSPFFGAGLGVFVAESPSWMGHPQVVHSTPLWILAEFGLLGAAVFSWMSFRLAAYAVSPTWGRALPSRSAFLLLLLMFAVFSLFHEMSYQRILWLVMGALLARPGAAAATRETNAQ